jgi:putative transposase
MGQAKMGEPERATRRGDQVRAVRDRDIKPGKVEGLLAGRSGWLVAERERRQAQTVREVQDRLRRELADALVTSVHEAWLQELKHAVSDADAAAIDAQWAAEIRQAKREARQLTAEQVRPASAGNRTPATRLPATRPGSSCGGHWRTAVPKFGIPEGWSVQAFCFALDPSPEQAACLRRQFGGRRYARNWAVRVLKKDLDRYRETGEQAAAPSLAGLRKRWNRVKDAECADRDTGLVWWPQVSKEAFADGIKGAVDGYWNWQASRAGTPGSRGSRRRAATGTWSPSPPEPSGSNPTAGMSPCPGSAPSGCTRTPAACSASWPTAGPGSSPSPSPGKEPA